MESTKFKEYSRIMWLFESLKHHFTLTFNCLSLGLVAAFPCILVAAMILNIFSLQAFYDVTHDFICISFGILTILLTLYANIKYFLLYEKESTIVVDEPHGEKVIYEIVRMSVIDEDENQEESGFYIRTTINITIEVKSSFFPNKMNQILYVRHPVSHEVFAYCRNCHQLIKLEDLCDECPHCHSYVTYAGPQ